MLAIDADAHVVESEQTWSYMDPGEAQYRPVLLRADIETNRQYWLIDGKVRGLRFPAFTAEQLDEMSRASGRNLTTPQEAREMTDIGLRIKHLDQTGVDIQVLHNTIFIEQATDRPAVEVALCRSWNRWVAGIHEKGQGRLRWSCVVPFMDIPEALEQLRYSKQHGACAFIMRPVEGSRLLHDPYFYPIYEEASRLDLAVAIHIANANPWLCDLFRHPVASAGGFARFRVPTVAALHDLLLSEVPQVFPALRFGFIEASAQWLPWVLHEAKNRFRSLKRPWPDNIMAEYRMFVTCENSDDIGYITHEAGDDALVIGTDYGHTDPSSDIDAIATFKAREDLTPALKHKILTDNPKALYAL